MKHMKKILIVLPCYNEGEALLHTIDALSKVHNRLAKKYRIDVLFINDGSVDDTQTVITTAATTHDFIYYRQFTYNAGHQSALRAGLNVAVDYDAAIMMDADLQHPPELIPDMIAKWEAGNKIVQMIRDDSVRDAGAFKYATSRMYYKVINGLSGLKLEYGASDFRLIDRTVTVTVAKSPESNLFLRGYFSWLKVPRVTIAYAPRKRIAGTSKYTLKKLLDLAYNGILQFSEKPLRIAVKLGVLFAALAVVYGLFLSILFLCGWHAAVSGWTSLMVVLVFCFGVNFILLGIIGSYLAHSISLQKQRPEFIIAAEKLPQA
ncbi:MAG TPA: glycosyltransferase family 2 protein [Candidatus Saccharimonas sp.]|nr:glycosyltransferase family 2 protein [Candidatus Saccharimonas sp.]